MSKGERIFVTGAAGFIGSHIVEYHLKKGDEVWAVDLLTDGSQAELPISPNLRFDHADVTTFPHLEEALMWSDKCYHLAATLGMYRVLSDPIRTLSNNIASTEAILEAAAATNTRARIMVASSSGIYAHTPLTEGGFKEDMALTFPSGKVFQESYYVSKLVNETMALAYCKEKGVFTSVVRFFNVVGPRQTGQYGMVIPRFVKQALEGEPLTVFGDGTQSRCFLNVQDATVALDKLLDTPAAAGEIVNIGHPEEVTILELAERVIAKTGSQSTIKLVPYKEAYREEYQDVSRRVPCTQKLQQLTGFEPTTTLDETLEQVINSFSLAHPRHSSP